MRACSLLASCAALGKEQPAIRIARCFPSNHCSGRARGKAPVLCVPVLLQAKLSQLGRLEERLDVKLAIAAELPGQFDGLAKQQAAGDYAVEGLRKDIKVGLSGC